jgi:hypothetical protein
MAVSPQSSEFSYPEKQSHRELEKAQEGKAKLRKRLHQCNVKKFLQKLKRVVMLKGVEIIEVRPAYTSITGMLKYAPQVSINKDIARACVRRVLGFKEDTSEHYEKLSGIKAYLEFILKRYEEKELRELLEKETNQYKRNALESELKDEKNARKLLINLYESLQSEPGSCEGADGRNPEQEETKVSQSAWQVSRVALLLLSVLGKVLPRDLSPLKPISVEGGGGIG